ncbi:pyruvate kinase [Acidithiobacillus sp. CV18-2]|uniref:Pyruvate kinase n=1 Tax=Igneacidithiobacillus copahuensis TaxID=2724909 RepID=A0AAE3CIV2_9PROT|nr:pyruvate kinase [Igneacidithiobacillus copahuensis]MBU2753812.1 pyruvate kinase [Acidithiobacillus sp. CV18-3]MBU2756490.1 pyruvate kinase [Acidithiobacillus sp. BN09-2]MBU2776425.1 pyruvate kinase [Acidithiobacillus sp. CV18-2]MBU2796328.1 pyruvate kinase [Acidithiobacillus sp. VAN18-2]MBU2799135.1 pyruvate kinase [Acidithiobacillus sp. VAN18-4]UTV81167.1 pyruvate kinase [Acidithiobacillus sp. YTS05]
MIRRTKIVATLGPASSSAEVIDRLIEAGLDVVRLNFSHGTAEGHLRTAELVRERARAHGRAIGVLADLQGPKIRIGKFAEGKIQLREGDPFILDIHCELGDQTRVGVTYPQLVKDVERGATLLLNDGMIVLWVDKVQGNEIHTRVVQGGELSNNKGINRAGGGLTAPALTDKDRQDIITAAQLEADYLAVSFPRSGADMDEARRLFREAGGHGALVAKIERAEAVEAIEDILKASEAVMVARGDLGVEIGDAAVPPVQKRIIAMAHRYHRITITATQMMESMIHQPIPTRAEVSDVANAVLDGTDAVMLSAETASGQYPVEAVAAMARTCLEVERQMPCDVDEPFFDRTLERVDETIAAAAILATQRAPIAAIAAFTESGSTALWLSRADSRVPIYALTPQVYTRRKVTLYRGVHPVNFPQSRHDDPLQVMRSAEDELRRRGVVRDGDLILITIGEPIGAPGGTNTLKLVRVGAASQI